jgi:hypothetical protein
LRPNYSLTEHCMSRWALRWEMINYSRSYGVFKFGWR